MQARLLLFALISSLLLCSAIVVSARDSKNSAATDSGQITGQVRFADSRQPAYNVLVSCDNISGGLIGQVLTDRNGRFSFTNLPLSQYNITVRVNGYIEEKQTVELMTSPPWRSRQHRPSMPAPPSGHSIAEIAHQAVARHDVAAGGDRL